MKTAENSDTSLWFANFLTKVTTAVNSEMLIELLKHKKVRVDTTIKQTVVDSEMIYQTSY